MSLLAEIVGLLISALPVVFSGWMIYEHRRLSAVVLQVSVETADRQHAELLLGDRLAEHTHPFWVHAHDGYHAPLEHEHTHDHPHQHEHVQHVHTLVKLSEHEDTGTRVVVKKCENCGTIFRDRGEALVNGRTQ